MGSADTESELERLREAERRLRSITEHAPDFILEFGRDGVITYMNRAAPGHTLDDMVGSNVRQWMEPTAHADFDRCVQHVFETGETSSYESVGAITGRHYNNRVSPVLSDSSITSAILITHDITDIRVAEHQLAEAERRYRALVESSFEGLCISVDRTLIYGNQAMADMFGYTLEEMVGLSPATMATPESAEVIKRNVAAGVETPYEVTCVRKDGTTFPCELLGRNIVHDGKPARITGFRDLTERRRQEAEQARRELAVRHAQKLETLGVLAGGIAHDFNNLLTIMLANIEMSISRVGKPERAREHMTEVRTAAIRARDLTTQLLVYAGRGEQEIETLDLNDLLRDAAALLNVSIAKSATLDFDLADELPAIEADVGQIRQIAMNLIINASDALDGGGTITVETGRVDADDAYLQDSFGDGGLQPGEYVYLAVADTGVGMNHATVSRIFDPFFTTKFTGRGLGLAAVQGIVRAHRGAIKVDSQPGRGTRFVVLLPSAGHRAATAVTEREQVRPAPRGKTVLVAEDEVALARTIQEALRSTGYTVILTEDGAEAIAAFEANADAIDIALLDVNMPKKTGVDVLHAIRAHTAELPVVLSSGFSDLRHNEVSANDGRVVVLNKPYGLDVLFDTLAECLTDSD